MKNQQKNENLIHQLNDLIDTNIFLIKKIKNSNDKKAKKKYKSNELKIKETLKDLIQSEIKNIDRDNKSRNAKELLALISYIQKIDSIYFNKDDCFYCGFTIDQCRCSNLLKKKVSFNTNYHINEKYHKSCNHINSNYHDNHHSDHHHHDDNHCDNNHCDDHHHENHHCDDHHHNNHHWSDHHHDNHHCDDHHHDNHHCDDHHHDNHHCDDHHHDNHHHDNHHHDNHHCDDHHHNNHYDHHHNNHHDHHHDKHHWDDHYHDKHHDHHHNKHHWNEHHHDNHHWNDHHHDHHHDKHHDKHHWNDHHLLNSHHHDHHHWNSYHHDKHHWNDHHHLNSHHHDKHHWNDHHFDNHHFDHHHHYYCKCDSNLKKLDFDLKLEHDDYLSDPKINILKELHFEKFINNFKANFDLCHSCGKNFDLCMCYFNNTCSCFDCMYVFLSSFDWDYKCIDNDKCQCFKCYNKNRIQSFKCKEVLYYDYEKSQNKLKRTILDENQLLDWIRSRDNEWIKFKKNSDILKSLINNIKHDSKLKIFLQEYHENKYNEINYKTMRFINGVLDKYRITYDIYIVKKECKSSKERDVTLSVIEFIRKKAY